LTHSFFLLSISYKARQKDAQKKVWLLLVSWRWKDEARCKRRFCRVRAIDVVKDMLVRLNFAREACANSNFRNGCVHIRWRDSLEIRDSGLSTHGREKPKIVVPFFPNHTTSDIIRNYLQHVEAWRRKRCRG
jgi:hypothetical protein